MKPRYKCPECDRDEWKQAWEYENGTERWACGNPECPKPGFLQEHNVTIDERKLRVIAGLEKFLTAQGVTV